MHWRASRINLLSLRYRCALDNSFLSSLDAGVISQETHCRSKEERKIRKDLAIAVGASSASRPLLKELGAKTFPKITLRGDREDRSFRFHKGCRIF